MNPRLVRALRWALACGWFSSLLWLAGCLDDVLGWRGPGAVFVAWSVPSLPLFLATAGLCGRRHRGVVSPLVSAAVVVWVSAMWWSVATHAVPKSPGMFVTAGILVVAVALGMIVWQGVVVWSWHAAPRVRISAPERRPALPPAPRPARRSSVATLARAG